MNAIPENFSQRVGRQVEKMVAVYFAREDGRRPDLYKLVIGMAEKPLIESILARHDGNLSRAALTLGINRNTLRKKMLDYGIHVSN